MSRRSDEGGKRRLAASRASNETSRLGAEALRALMLAALVLASACAPETPSDSPTPGVVIRDSAGINIVANHEPAWGPGEGWRLAAGPELTIGRIDGPRAYTFSAATPSVLSDGRILVAEHGTRELRYFAADGTHLETVGGEGGGPGEFSSLRRVVVLPGDTVLAFDARQATVTVFDEAGSLVRTVPFDRPQEAIRVRFYGAAQPAAWAIGMEFRIAGPDGGARRAIEVGVYDERGRRQTVLDTLTRPGSLVQEAGNGMRLMVTPPFEPVPSAAAGNGLIYVAHGRDFEVLVYTTDGELRRIIRLDRPRRPVTERDVRRHMARVEENFERFDIPPDFRQAFREMNERAARSSEFLPESRAVAVGRLGYLFVWPWAVLGSEVNSPPSPPTLIFDPAGRWLGELQVPDGYAITDLAADYVLVVWRDELDVSYVGRLALDRTP